MLNGTRGLQDFDECVIVSGFLDSFSGGKMFIAWIEMLENPFVAIFFIALKQQVSMGA